MSADELKALVQRALEGSGCDRSLNVTELRWLEIALESELATWRKRHGGSD